MRAVEDQAARNKTTEPTRERSVSRFRFCSKESGKLRYYANCASGLFVWDI